MFFHIINFDDKSDLIFFTDSYEIVLVSKKVSKAIKDYYIQKSDKNTVASLHEIEIADFEDILTKITNLREYKPEFVTESKMADIALKINLTNNCNLYCKYCYTSDRYRDTSVLDSNNIPHIINFVERNFNSQKVHITFFGGEPLLNVPTMESICSAFSKLDTQKNISFGIITNGTNINEKVIAIFKKFNFSVTVSIDGSKIINDQLRVYQNGNGSYDKIAESIDSLLKAGIDVRYEATYTKVHEKNNLTYNDVKKHMLTRFGLKHGTIASVSHPKEYKPNDILAYKFNEKDFDADFIIGNDTAIRILQKRKERYICGMGKNHFVINTDCNIYPCQFFINNPDFNLGSVRDNKLTIHKETADLFHQIDHFTNDDCLNCWAKYLCKDCPAKIYQETGHIKPNKKYCEEKKQHFEESIKMLCILKKDKLKYQSVLKILKERREGV